MRNLGKSIGSKAHVRANPKGQEAVRVEGGSGGVPPGTSFRTAGEATEAEPFRRISSPPFRGGEVRWTFDAPLGTVADEGFEIPLLFLLLCLFN
jgi:hypothetical protein